jgi:hypothetical protein
MGGKFKTVIAKNIRRQQVGLKARLTPPVQIKFQVLSDS